MVWKSEWGPSVWRSFFLVATAGGSVWTTWGPLTAVGPLAAASPLPASSRPCPAEERNSVAGRSRSRTGCAATLARCASGPALRRTALRDTTPHRGLFRGGAGGARSAATGLSPNMHIQQQTKPTESETCSFQYPITYQQTQPSIVARFPSAARITRLQTAQFSVHAVKDFIGAGAWLCGR